MPDDMAFWLCGDDGKDMGLRQRLRNQRGLGVYLLPSQEADRPEREYQDQGVEKRGIFTGNGGIIYDKKTGFSPKNAFFANKIYCIILFYVL